MTKLDYFDIFFAHAPLAIVALYFQGILLDNVELCGNLLVVRYADWV